MHTIVGTWAGEITGTNRGFFLLEISQQDSSLSGIARINEPTLGVSVFQVTGNETRLTLIPIASAPPELSLGTVSVEVETALPDQIRGRWVSTIGTAGTFEATRQKHRTTKSSSVFVVHGHDEAAREGVARVLEKLGLTPIILMEQPSSGDTVIEKLERHSDVGYVVVLLTPDDEGHQIDRPKDVRKRARQNVVLELGYFIAKLGRRGVCALTKGDIEIPSDYRGVVYVPLDANGGWKLHLATELKAAGYDIDINRLIAI